MGWCFGVSLKELCVVVLGKQKGKKEEDDDKPTRAWATPATVPLT